MVEIVQNKGSVAGSPSPNPSANRTQNTSTGLAQVPASSEIRLQTGLTIEEIRRETVTVLYALSGIGKSTLSRLWGPNPLCVMMTGGGEHRPMHLIGTDVPYISVAGRNALDGLVARLLAEDAKRKVISQDPFVLSPLVFEGKEISSIVVDQLSSFYRMQSEDVLVFSARSRENAETLCQGDYKQLRRRAHLFVNGLTKIRVHKLYLCIMEIDKDEKGNPVRISPGLSDSLVSDFMSFADFVFFMTTETYQEIPGRGPLTQRRVIHTQPGEITQSQLMVPFVAKDSSGLLPAKIPIPSKDFNLFEYVMGILDPTPSDKS